MTSKIRIKFSGIEIEYEGEHTFLQTELLALMKNLMEIAPAANLDDSGREGNPERKSHVGTLTVSTVAQRLKIDSGPGLIQAALLQSARVEKKESLPRKDLLAKMKAAGAYYKDSYSANLSSNLKSLTKSGEIHSVGDEVYALAPATAKKLEAQLVESG